MRRISLNISNKEKELHIIKKMEVYVKEILYHEKS